MVDLVAETDTLRQLASRLRIPDTYVVLDTETTGFSPDNDFIIEVGWAVIKNRQVVHTAGMLLDWRSVPVNHDFLKAQLRRQAEDYAKIGRPHYFPWERLTTEGEPALEVLSAFLKLIEEHLDRQDSLLVGHNFWKFDRDMLNGHVSRFFEGYNIPWSKNTIIDTGLIEKAAQLRMLPHGDETIDDWYTRISQKRARVKWSLENHCVPKYRLTERFNVDMALMHTAGFDCTLTHYLLDTYRQLMEIMDG